MNFFGNDIVKGMMNVMANNTGWNTGNEKENALRNNLERCTYPDEYSHIHAGPSGPSKRQSSSSSTSTPSSTQTSSCSVLLPARS